jgi:tripartite-type tricarboxylate transporter receptor subunit TctC
MRTSKVKMVLLLSLILTVLIIPALFGEGVREEQDFPAERPVRLINPYAPGGATDISGRILAATAPEFLGQTVSVVSMSGAGGQEALNFIVDDPTGYNLLITDYGPLITTALTEDVRYELDDWVPIIQISEGHPVFFVHSDSPIQTVEDWVEKAKADPGSLTIAHGRYLAPPHLPLILFEQKAGIKNTHVATTGGSEARAFVRGGQVDMGSSVTTSILPMVEAGEFHAVAVPIAERSPIMPDVPTLKELGYDVVFPFWFTVFAHKDTPEEDMRILEDAFLKAFETESAKVLAEKSGVALKILGMDEAMPVYQNTVESLKTIMEAVGE